MAFTKFLNTRFLYTFICVVAVFSAAVTPAFARNANKAVPKYSSMVMDAGTGQILSQHNPDTSVYPASLTKMMTLLMLFDALEAGQVKMTTAMRVSKRAQNASPSKLGLKAGQTIKVRDAMMGLITKSANDAAVVIAEHLGGSEDSFARKMTARARALGMTRTRFMNASGLHNSSQVTTARDMLRLSAILIGHYPSYYGYFKTRSFNYRGRTLQNHNRLMSSYKGMDGLKTGFIRQSGFNLAASAKRNGQRVIGVVFGGRSATSRNAHMAELLDAGFRKIAGQPSITPEPILADIAPVTTQRNKKTTQKSSRPKLQVSAGTIPDGRARPSVAPVPADLNGEELEALAIDPNDLERAPGTIPVKAGSFGASVARAAQTKGYQHIHVQGQGENSAVLSQQRQMVYEDTSLQKNSEQRGWAIQIGAYTSREATDQALMAAKQRLPQDLSHASPLIAPVRNPDQSWMYRARLSNLSRTEAVKACRYFKDCMTVGGS